MAAPEKPIAIVTGAAQGIGLGIARALALASHRVMMGDVDRERLEQSARALQTDGGDVVAQPLDVTNPDEWASALAALDARWGRLDTLVNNAGISPRGTAESTDLALWDLTLAINLKGAWLGAKACLPWLKTSQGVILNIGSTRSTRPMPGLFSYVVSKAGLWGMTRQLAVEYLHAGVRCNMIAPGWVDTPNERLLQARHGRPDFPAGVANLTTPEQVGAAAVYLASPAARTISGVTLYLDSGLHVADEAGMVFFPETRPLPFPQRIDEE